MMHPNLSKCNLTEGFGFSELSGVLVSVYVCVCAYLLFGGQFSYTVRFVESKIDHSLKQGNGLF